MRYVLSIIIALLVAISIAIFLKEDPGLFVFNYAGYTVQMSFALFVVMLIVAVLLIYLFISLLVGIYRSPRNVKRWSKHRKAVQAEHLITQGLSHMLLGEWKKAEKIFIKGAKSSSHPMLNYLFAARAAQQQGRIDNRDRYLTMAQNLNDGESNMVDLTQAELQLEHSQTDQAYATLIHARPDAKGKRHADTLMLKASLELHEWNKALDILDVISAKKLMAREHIHAKRLKAYSGLLLETANSPVKDDLCNIWNSLPGKFQKEIFLIDIYITERIRYPFTADCEAILRKVLRRTWDEGLVRLYGLVEAVDTGRQVAFAEKLLNSNAGNPVLLLTLGRLHIKHKDPDRARSYLEACIEVKPNAEAYKELATMLERQGDQAGAAIYFQEGLNIATGLPGTGDVRLLQNNPE